MTTVINNPGETRVERTVERTDSGAGWAIAIILLLVILGLGAYFYHHRGGSTVPGNTNINVTLPSTSGSTNAPASY